MVIDNENEEEDIILDDDISDEEQDDAQEIEVDLDEEEEEDDKPIGNKAWAAMRVENKELKKTVEELNRSVKEINTNQPTPIERAPAATGNSDDPRTWSEEKWDSLAQSDWKKAVDLRSKLQAEKINQEYTHTAEFNKVLEESKQNVLIRHPELNDPNSEKAKVYRNIVVANPDYTMQKKGPLTAMYEMEDYMEKNMGYKREDIVKAETRARAAEASRQSRVSLTSTVGHNISEGNKVMITKDEMDFCKLQGIDPKVYATNKKKLAGAGKGGVQL